MHCVGPSGEITFWQEMEGGESAVPLLVAWMPESGRKRRGHSGSVPFRDMLPTNYFPPIRPYLLAVPQSPRGGSVD